MKGINVFSTFVKQNNQTQRKMAKLFKVTASNIGDNKLIQRFVDDFSNKPATKENIYIMEQDIDFIVCDCKIAHGNISRGDAWLYDRINNDGFRVNVSW